jgi:hypothetical protein
MPELIGTCERESASRAVPLSHPLKELGQALSWRTIEFKSSRSALSWLSSGARIRRQKLELRPILARKKLIPKENAPCYARFVTVCPVCAMS